jgi:hypothetical protein
MMIGTPAQAGYVTDTLGAAGPSNYAILALSGAQDIALNGPGQTQGNVGVSSGTLSLNGSSGPEVKGNVYLATGAGISTGNGTQVTGTIYSNQELTQANAAALSAAATFSALAPTQSLGTITGTTIITGSVGLNVIDITNLNLGNGQSLTLTGPAGAQFVINDTGGLTLNSGHINVSGGLMATDVVLNVVGLGSDLQTSGGLNNESVINAILLAPDRKIGFAPGLINSELIAGGQSIHLVSGASADGLTSVPEPSSLALAALAGVLLLAHVGCCHLSRNRKSAESHLG